MVVALAASLELPLTNYANYILKLDCKGIKNDCLVFVITSLLFV